MQHQRLKQQQHQALMQHALLQQQSLYHPGLLAAPQVHIFWIFVAVYFSLCIAVEFHILFRMFKRDQLAH